jgi:hypothetical protein
MARAGQDICRGARPGWHIAAANDPFFGSRGDALGATQLAKGLKYEMLIAIKSADEPTACMSFNCHETHFAGIWDIRLADGALARTSCVGFGMERLALALFATHGVDLNLWPPEVRKALWTV